MRKVKITLALIAAACLTSCFGPRQLSRSLDDWENQLYVSSPWGTQWLNFLGPLPLARVGAGFADLFVDFVRFWGEDAWSCPGSGFLHSQVEKKDNTVRSLMLGSKDK